MKDELSDFVTVNMKSHRNSTSSLDGTQKPEPQKLSEKVTRKFQSGKRKILSMAANGRDSGLEGSTEENVGGGKKEVEHDGIEGPAISTLTLIKDGSHSATSSPQRQVKTENRQRALSDTSLHKVSVGMSYGYVLIL